jgi:hypothetical protein
MAVTATPTCVPRGDLPDHDPAPYAGGMNTLEEWTVAVCADLGVPHPDTKAILDMAREVAHGVDRPAAPLTAFLVGVAVGHGQDEQSVIARVADMARQWGNDNSKN